MADKSNIEWTDATWNPIRARNLATGKLGWHCEHVTEACRFCYAEGMNANIYFGNGLPYKPGVRDQVEIFLDEATLLKPLHWKKPRKIFVCSMTDLYGSWVKDEWLHRIYAVMARCPQHTFIVLTKRPERMREYLTDVTDGADAGYLAALQYLGGTDEAIADGTPWPLPNVWAGCSCANQPDADRDIPIVLATPLAKRIVSLEPLLGPIDLIGTLARYQDSPQKRDCAVPLGRQLIDWVIVGGESGKNARPMHPDWARSLRDQCKAAGVPFFFKQWGEWAHLPETSEANPDRDHFVADHGNWMRRVGKKAAGRLLDGVEHSEWPEGMP